MSAAPERELRAILRDTISGRRTQAEFDDAIADSAGAEEFVEATLAESLVRQDWDAVDILALACVARPQPRSARALSAILDRQCLEISNRTLVAALAVTGSPQAVPALRRALEHTPPPHPEWVPGPAGDAELEELRTACRGAIMTIEAQEPRAYDSQNTGKDTP